MIEFSYNKDENIIYVKRSGDVYLDDILKIIDDINIKMNQIKSLYILQDSRDSSMKYDIADLKPMIELFEQRLNAFKVVRIANFTDDPIETATAFVFEELASKLDNLYHRTFSTFDSAKYWLITSIVNDLERN